MSDTGPVPALEALYARLRTVEMEAVVIRARHEEISNLIDMLEHPRRPRGRPRKDPTIIELPQRVEGGSHTPDDAA